MAEVGHHIAIRRFSHTTCMSDPLVDYLTIDSEDDLTRVVFGIVELVGDKLLDAILAKADISLDGQVRYSFHTKIDPSANRTPDVILKSDGEAVMVEVKRGRSVNVDQLREEREDVRTHGGKEGELVLITGHDERPPELEAEELQDVRWIGWRDVTVAISAIETESFNPTQRRLVQMLRSKLEEEGYVPFTGIDASLLEDVAETRPTLRQYYSQINTFNRDLAGRVDTQGLQAKNLWRDGISQDFHRFPADWRFITDHLWIAYGPPDREIKSKHGRYPFVAFCWPGESVPSVRVGYSFSPGYQGADRTFLAEHAQEIASFIDSSEYLVVRTSWGFAKREAFVDADELQPILSEEETIGGFDRIQLVAEYGTDRLTKAAVTDAVADNLVEVNHFVEHELNSPA